MYESRQRSKPALLPRFQSLGYFVYSKLRYPSSAALCRADIPEGQKAHPTGEPGRPQCCSPSPAETSLGPRGSRSLPGFSRDQAQGGVIRGMQFVTPEELQSWSLCRGVKADGECGPL